MGKRLIATGTTDSNGQVKITYTGKGAGKLQLTAESGTLTSETYNLYDCLYVDIGTRNNHNDNRWAQWSNYPSDIERGTNETTVTKQTDNTVGYHIYVHPDVFTDELVEFDVYVTSSVNNNIFLQIRDNSRTVIKQIALSTFSLTAGEWYHFQINFNTGTISNTTNSNTSTFTTGDSKSVYLAVQTNQSDVKYKNFMIYPI